MTKNEARFLLTLKPNESVSVDQFEQAYRVIFRTDLHERLKGLVAEYGKSDTLSWELWDYGWNSPAELLGALSA